MGCIGGACVLSQRSIGVTEEAQAGSSTQGFR